MHVHPRENLSITLSWHCPLGSREDTELRPCSKLYYISTQNHKELMYEVQPLKLSLWTAYSWPQVRHVAGL